MSTPEEDILEVRIPRTLLYFGVVICLILMLVPAVSVYFAGVFRWAEAGFMLLIFIFLCAFLIFGSFTTTFSPAGISCKSLRISWKYSWEQIEFWGRDISPNGEEAIYFLVKGSEKRHYIQGLQENMLNKVRKYFTNKCGEAKIG